MKIPRFFEVAILVSWLMLGKTATLHSATLQQDDTYNFPSSTIKCSLHHHSHLYHRVHTNCLPLPRHPDSPTPPWQLPNQYFVNLLTQNCHIPALESKQLVGLVNHGTGATALSLEVYKYHSVFDSEIGKLLYNHSFPTRLSTHPYSLDPVPRKTRHTSGCFIYLFWIKKDVFLQLSSPSSHPS